MGLLQKAVETYEAHSSFVGEESQEHQVLLPSPTSWLGPTWRSR